MRGRYRAIISSPQRVVLTTECGGNRMGKYRYSLIKIVTAIILLGVLNVAQGQTAVRGIGVADPIINSSGVTTGHNLTWNVSYSNNGATIDITAQTYTLLQRTFTQTEAQATTVTGVAFNVRESDFNFSPRQSTYVVSVDNVPFNDRGARNTIVAEYFLYLDSATGAGGISFAGQRIGRDGLRTSPDPSRVEAQDVTSTAVAVAAGTPFTGPSDLWVILGFNGAISNFQTFIGETHSEYLNVHRSSIPSGVFGSAYSVTVRSASQFKQG